MAKYSHLLEDKYEFEVLMKKVRLKNHNFKKKLKLENYKVWFKMGIANRGKLAYQGINITTLHILHVPYKCEI